MLKFYLKVILIVCCSTAYAQETFILQKNKKIPVLKDSIYLEKNSINPSFFELKNAQNQILDTSYYHIDFQKSLLILKPKFQKSTDSIQVSYQKWPDFLTKKYAYFDDNRIVKNEYGDQLYKSKDDQLTPFKPLDGLNTSGSISRGLTIGNNQTSVVNSNLDLQIIGKIAQNISLKASIQDSNIPLKNDGYSQRLNEFDQIFIELQAPQWQVRAGDLFLENRQSTFLNFNKKLQGVSTQITTHSQDAKTNIYASAAVVRGQYAKSNFVGQEGNQGPYKLRGSNDELYVLVIAGSERVFVNGILLERGENKQYVIDYNAGEIRFTALYPINSEMRIAVEYQYTNQNFTRFVAYSGVQHEAKKWQLSSFIYSENDVKNQPLMQNLSADQVSYLVAAGDNPNLMVAPSAFLDTYSNNKILYKKVIQNNETIFEYSNNSTDELYQVKFLLVGNNQGHYRLGSANAIGKIYQYVAPIGGILQGNYEPIVKLVAPIKLQMATVFGKYNPNDKTNISFEVAVSQHDQNLFSNLDDANNIGLASKWHLKQRLISKKWQLDALANFDIIQQHFKPIERVLSIEFNRDWSLPTVGGEQQYWVLGLQATHPQKGLLQYQYENLAFGSSFSGNKHLFLAQMRHQKWHIFQQTSYLQSHSTEANTLFFKNDSKITYTIQQNRFGLTSKSENNQQRLWNTNTLSALSQRFNAFSGFVSRGDSTKVFVELGFQKRFNDSLQQGILKRVNQSTTYYIKSKLIQNQTQQLSFYLNHRTLAFENILQKKETAINSRILYNGTFLNQLIQNTFGYETQSGSVPQQEFTYIEVPPGQGVYAWNDYNQNGIQELQEFETAPFPDQAKYVRVFLPNQIFVKTHQNKLTENLIINPSVWQNKFGSQSIWTRFYNHTNLLAERKILQLSDHFDLNPFGNSNQALSINTHLRNALYYNRGKQQHAITYTFLKSNIKNWLSVGSVENQNQLHQLQYEHLIQKSWLAAFQVKSSIVEVSSENYTSRNYKIKSFDLMPSLRYLFSKTTNLDFIMAYQQKENVLLGSETLKQSHLGLVFSYMGQSKTSVSAETHFYNNQFQGNPISPVAFQMLEGLQAGQNSTWRLMVQKNITQYLNLSIQYQGRKSATSQTIHTGNIQLKAFF